MSGTSYRFASGGVHGAELARVRRAEIRRRLHAREQHGDAASARALDDRAEVVVEIARRQAAQAVVRAERDDEHLDPAFERPVEAAESAGRRVT